ncbi:MAG: FCD domain-containing protein [Clostridiales bacterium]|nr:FCD domain-containing protein [Clostridiales bacterium]
MCSSLSHSQNETSQHCPNVTLRNFTLQSQHQIIISTLHYQVESEYRERSLKDHQNIYEAIASNDILKAEALMHEHNAFSLAFISKESEER